MEAPFGFSWIIEKYLAGLAFPESEEDLKWLRQNNIDLLISLTEEPPHRRHVNQAGLMLVHIPVVDFSAPSQSDLTMACEAIKKANDAGLGAAVHCMAGRGRTGTVLASWLVYQGMNSSDAIKKIRQLRPGSIETLDQEEAIHMFGRSLKTNNGLTDDPPTDPNPLKEGKKDTV